MMGVNLMGQQGEFIEEIWEHLLSKTAVKFTPLHDSVLVMVDLGPTEIGSYLEDSLEAAFKVISKIKPNVTAELSIGRDVQDMLELVRSVYYRSEMTMLALEKSPKN